MQNASYRHARVTHSTRIITHISTPTLHHVIPIQPGHLALCLQPHLVLCQRCNHLERGNLQAELSTLGELACAHAERRQVFTGYVGCALHDGFAEMRREHDFRAKLKMSEVKDERSDRRAKRDMSTISKRSKEKRHSTSTT